MLEKHLLGMIRALKNLCLTVSPELMDILHAFVSYSAKINSICVQSNRPILCEELVS